MMQQTSLAKKNTKIGSDQICAGLHFTLQALAIVPQSDNLGAYNHCFIDTLVLMSTAKFRYNELLVIENMKKILPLEVS